MPKKVAADQKNKILIHFLISKASHDRFMKIKEESGRKTLVEVIRSVLENSKIRYDYRNVSLDEAIHAASALRFDLIALKNDVGSIAASLQRGENYAEETSDGDNLVLKLNNAILQLKAYVEELTKLINKWL